MSIRPIAVVGLVVLAALLYGQDAVYAQDPPTYRAGIVVQYGDGAVETACVEFEEPALDGFELLQRSGIEFSYDTSTGLRVCSIAGEGCRFPAEDCFCQCQGIGTCTYWSYWRLSAETGEWTYSQLGAAAQTIEPGDVDGWRWGVGTPGDAPEPPLITFEEICLTLEDAPTATAAQPATATAAATATSSFQVMPSVTTEPASGTTRVSATPRATPTNAPTFTPQPSPTTPATHTPVASTVEEQSDGIPMQYVFFGALVVVLAGGLLWMQRQ